MNLLKMFTFRLPILGINLRGIELQSHSKSSFSCKKLVILLSFNKLNLGYHFTQLRSNCDTQATINKEDASLEYLNINTDIKAFTLCFYLCIDRDYSPCVLNMYDLSNTDWT